MIEQEWTAPLPGRSRDHGREADLVDRAAQDREAFGALYRAHCRAVANHLWRRTGDHHVTEDLTAEVFLRALHSLPRFRRRGIPLRHWLLRIAANLATNHMRGRRRTEAGVEDLAAPEADATAADRRRRLRVALAELPARYQTVLGLHYLEELGVDPLARLLGVRPGTVKSRLSRGRALLRDRLNHGEDLS